MKEKYQNYWICQGNNTADVIVPGKIIPWRVWSYMRQIRSGDIVYFWKMGADAGIYGWGTSVSDAPTQDEEEQWRYEIRCDKVFKKWIPKERVRQEPDLEVGLALFINPRGSLSPVDSVQALMINGIIREMKLDPPPDPSLIEGELQPGPKALKLSRDAFLERIGSAAPNIDADMTALFNQTDKLGIQESYGSAALILNWNHFSKRRFILGMIRTDGTLDTRYVVHFAQAATDKQDIGLSYLTSIAALIEGATVEQKDPVWNWGVMVGGKRPNASEILSRHDEWLKAISLFIEEISRILQKNIEGLPIHSDAPSKTTDHLMHRPFAAGISWRLRYMHRYEWPLKDENGNPISGAFLVHLYAPWGAGKTTVLNFLEQELNKYIYEEKHRWQEWIVVDFNAWKHQKTSPPWWPFLKAVSRKISQVLWNRKKYCRSAWHSMKEYAWRTLRGRFHLLIALPAFILVLVLSNMDGLLAEIARGLAEDLNGEGTQQVETALKILATFIGIVGSIWAFLRGIARSLVTGSSSAAESYTRESKDPEGQLKRRFERIVKQTSEPIAIFIDDLDRCNMDYAVEFLEGIQTMFREATVAYVIAADRAWLCNCYTKTYKDFEEVVKEHGRPLGHLFLEKTFQISVPLPNMTGVQKSDFFKYLLKTEESDKPSKFSEDDVSGLSPSTAEAPAKPKLEELNKEIRRIAAPEAIAEMTDELVAMIRYVPDILEANPRAIKRTVNILSMWRTIDLLQGGRISNEFLARWSVANTRWPALIDLLTSDPDLADEIGKDDPKKIQDADLLALFKDHDVEQVFTDKKFELRLGNKQVRAILGEES